MYELMRKLKLMVLLEMNGIIIMRKIKNEEVDNVKIDLTKNDERIS